MEHWNIGWRKTLVSEWLSFFQSFVVEGWIKGLRELFDVLRHIVIRLHLLGSHGLGMELNLGLRKIAVSLGQRLRVLGFFGINFSDLSFYLLLSWLDGLKFSFDLFLAWRRGYNFGELLSTLHVRRRWVYHFKQLFTLEWLLDIFLGLLLVVFAQVLIDARNHLLSLLALCGQNLDLLDWLRRLVLDKHWTHSWLDQSWSGMIKNRSIQPTSIIFFLLVLGFLELLLDSLKGLHWILSFSFVVLSFQLIKLLLLLFSLLLVQFSLLGFKFSDTHRRDAQRLFLYCWHRFLAVIFGIW